MTGLSTQQFVDHVRGKVQAIFDSYSGDQRSMNWAFAQWCMGFLFPSIDSDRAFTLVVQPEQHYISARYQDEDSGTYYVISVRYSDKPAEQTFSPDLVKGLVSTCQKINDTAEKQTRDCFDLSDAFSTTNDPIFTEAVDAVKNGYSLCAVAILFGNIGTTTDVHRSMPQIGEQLEIYDLARLRDTYNHLEITEKLKSIDLPFESYATKTTPLQAVVGNVSAYVYKEMVKGLVPEIYDANLRVALVSRYNRDMKETLQDEMGRKLFWYYNNGITITCDNIEHIGNRSEGGEFRIHGPRVVNGAQTTNAIIATPFADDDDVTVMIRVIAIPASHSLSKDIDLSELYTDIARYTNSQNPIKTPDFKANDPVQVKLESEFADLRWFYEHKRGQWRSLARAEKRRFRINGQYRRIEMVELAQRWYAFNGHPVDAIRGKDNLFAADGTYTSIFSAHRTAEELLIGYLLFGRIQELVTKNIRDAKQVSADTRQSSAIDRMAYYRAIGGATRRAVAHLAAVLGMSLEKRYGKFNRELVGRLRVMAESNELIDQVFPDLEDALFRLLYPIVQVSSQHQEETPKTAHQKLSEAKAVNELFGLFEYVIEREQARGRDVLAI